MAELGLQAGPPGGCAGAEAGAQEPWGAQGSPRSPLLTRRGAGSGSTQCGRLPAPCPSAPHQLCRRSSEAACLPPLQGQGSQAQSGGQSSQMPRLQHYGQVVTWLGLRTRGTWADCALLRLGPALPTPWDPCLALLALPPRSPIPTRSDRPRNRVIPVTWCVAGPGPKQAPWGGHVDGVTLRHQGKGPRG
ncbi:hypothetical protein H1C71_039874 [Ictidomys tridecemlineatus]|nr:hypothetical protein H1C71_039874 [Ictidomys tridecemlineatus]